MRIMDTIRVGPGAPLYNEIDRASDVVECQPACLRYLLRWVRSEAGLEVASGGFSAWNSAPPYKLCSHFPKDGLFLIAQLQLPAGVQYLG
jgi:hypothetical protein